MTTDRLNAIDAAFLDIEDPENRMQLAGLLIFKGDAPSYEEFRAVAGERLLSLPRLRQRLQFAPLGLVRPTWVDDPAFDLDYHLSRVALPRPGSHEEITAHIDKMTSIPLDLHRPLWELGLVEGVADGFAISLKVHHCMVDGLSIMDIFAALIGPDSDLPAMPHIQTQASAARGSLSEKARASIQRMTTALSLAGQAPRTMFNSGPSGPTRRTEYVTIDLQDVIAIKRHYEVTVNSVVLSVVAGSISRYLNARSSSIDTVHAFVPVNRRAEQDRGKLGNQIAMTYPALPVATMAASERIGRVATSASAAERKAQAASTAMLMGVLGKTPAPLASVLNRAVQFKGDMFNLTVTNVPGPPLPAHFLGRPLDLILGSTPVTRRHALTVAALSYDGRLTFSVTTDPRRVPDPQALIAGIQAELAELSLDVATPTSRQREDKA